MSDVIEECLQKIRAESTGILHRATIAESRLAACQSALQKAHSLLNSSFYKDPEQAPHLYVVEAFKVLDAARKESNATAER